MNSTGDAKSFEGFPLTWLFEVGNFPVFHSFVSAFLRQLKQLKAKFLDPGAPAWSTIFLAAGVAAFVALIALKIERSAFVPGTKGQNDHVASFDFAYASYYPVRDCLAGNNPYEPHYADRNPDGEDYPAYSPIHLLLHVPFGAFRFETARWVYFACNVVLLIGVAWLVVRIIDKQLGWNAALLVAILMFASRPGYKTLFYGQATVLPMLGTYLALWMARDRPWLAGLGLALVSIKVQFLVPLGFLMLFRGNIRALMFGALFSMIGSFIPMGFIASNLGTYDSLTAGIYQNYIEAEQHPAVREPGSNWARVDFVDQLAKASGIKFSTEGVFAISIGFWVFGAFVLLKTRDREDLNRADGAAAALILGIVLMSVYHVYYDFLYLTLPLCAILYRSAPFWIRIDRWQWLVVLFGFGLGIANHLLEKMATGFEGGSMAWRFGVTANSAALLVALGLLAWLLLKAARTEAAVSGSVESVE